MTMTKAEIQRGCRDVLAQLTFNRAILARDVPRVVLAALEGRRLIQVPFEGYIGASTRAHGYAADPDTFEL